MANAQYELEIYFAKNYNKLYVKFGGQYIDYRHPIIPSPMQNYFSSGKYKELDDPALNLLWKKAQKERNFRFIIIAVLLVSLSILFAVISVQQ
jgi:hypothetical protein